MGEDVSGRENEDELTQRDKGVAAHSKNSGHSGYAGSLGKVESENTRERHEKYVTMKLSEPGNRQPQED